MTYWTDDQKLAYPPDHRRGLDRPQERRLVTLALADVLTDYRDAVRDQARVDAAGWKETGWMPPGGPLARLEYRIVAYRAERAFAIHRGVPFVRDPDGFGAPDVDGFSVRYGARDHYGLVTHLRDHEMPYVLVVQGADPLTFGIAGYMSFADALELRTERIGRALPGTTGAWVIPQGYLRAAWPDRSGE